MEKKLVYIDPERTIPIYPDSPNIQDYVGKALYCSNPQCRARMFIRKADKPDEAYFQASGKPPHIGDCGMSGTKEFKTGEYNEEAFHYLDALQNLEIPSVHNGPTAPNCPPNEPNPEITAGPMVLHTLKQIHTMASHMAPEDSYGDISIKDLLVDRRTLSYYAKGLNGYKIVECKLHRYINSNSEHSVVMNYSLDNTEPLFVKLNFEDKSLFQTLLPVLFCSKSAALAVISGNFHNVEIPLGKAFIKSECTIYSSKQIAVYM